MPPLSRNERIAEASPALRAKVMAQKESLHLLQTATGEKREPFSAAQREPDLEVTPQRQLRGTTLSGHLYAAIGVSARIVGLQVLPTLR
ncbi:hypothetical protein F518_22600 [Serratia marcescens VGH107]|nr:hypothetical protein F518_22600 [Serratia marcescens VGH107]